MPSSVYADSSKVTNWELWINIMRLNCGHFGKQLLVVKILHMAVSAGQSNWF